MRGSKTVRGIAAAVAVAVIAALAVVSGASGDGAPSVEFVTPPYARAGDGVTIHGTNLGEVTEVHFGTVPASFHLFNAGQMTATVPPGSGTVDVAVTNASGTSAIVQGDRFTYEEQPEFGRCVREPGGPYSEKGCETEGEVKFIYSWYPAFGAHHPLEHLGVQMSGNTTKIETAAGVKIACTHISASAAIDSAKTIAIPSLVLTGCQSSQLGQCQSEGAAAGEVRSEPLTARLESGAQNKPGAGAVLVSPASEETIAELDCGPHTLVLGGAFVLVNPKIKKMVTSTKLSATGKKGVQTPPGVLGEPPVSPELSIDGAAAQPAGISIKVTAAFEEAVMVR